LTRKRNDDHSTEFGLWLRNQDRVSSSKGYVATNIDFMWKHIKSGKWMLIEEKRYMSKATWSQRELFKIVHKACISDPNYCGIHLIQFENTSPDDGKVYIDNKEVTHEELIKFLQFYTHRSLK